MSKPQVDGELEKRSIGGEIRSVDEDKGEVTSYLTKWETVDSWNTKFERGSFLKTFEKRGASGMRLFWNHNELAGKLTELREDDYGPIVTAQFNLDTDAGKKAFAHVRAKDVDCFSFGFNTVKDRWDGSVRSIQEVDMRECGPVIFQANDEAKITDVRAEDFDQTVMEREMRQRGWRLLSALDSTIDDIYWTGNKTADETISMVDMAISKFHSAYVGWLKEYYDTFESRESAEPPRECRNDIQGAMNSLDIANLTGETTLTNGDVENLKKGKLLAIESRSKLDSLPEVLRDAHKTERRKKIETFCNELRQNGFDDSEKERFLSLLKASEKRTEKPGPSNEIDDAMNFFKELRNKF